MEIVTDTLVARVDVQGEQFRPHEVPCLPDISGERIQTSIEHRMLGLDEALVCGRQLPRMISVVSQHSVGFPQRRRNYHSVLVILRDACKCQMYSLYALTEAHIISYVKRTPLTRKSPMRRTPIQRSAPAKRKPWKRADDDKVSPEDYAFVIKRDGGCIARFYDNTMVCWGRITLDHVKDDPRMGDRAKSNPAHLVSVCQGHSEDGRKAGYQWNTANRDKEREYLESKRG